MLGKISYQIVKIRDAESEKTVSDLLKQGWELVCWTEEERLYRRVQ